MIERPCRIEAAAPAWRRALAVAVRLREAGHVAVAVGGAVRDHLLGLPVADVDLATDADPDRVLALFPRCLAVGRQFGVVVVVDDDGGHTEVASFRSDRAYVDGRRPTGIDAASEAEDVERRDFTINALVYDPVAGVIRDRVGGLADLEAKTLRVVGDAAARLREDRLRVLRGCRFAARLGFTIAPASWSAMCSTSVAGLSRERIWQELDKALAHPGRATWWNLVVRSGRAGEVLPPVADAAVPASALDPLPAEADPDAATALLLAAGGVRAEGAAAWLAGEPVARPRQKRLVWILAQAAAGAAGLLGLGLADRRRVLQHEAATALLAVIAARHPGSEATELSRLLAVERAAGPFRPLVRAEHLLGLGLRPGKALGEALKWLEDRQLEGQCHNIDEGLELWRRHGPGHGDGGAPTAPGQTGRR